MSIHRLNLEIVYFYTLILSSDISKALKVEFS